VLGWIAIDRVNQRFMLLKRNTDMRRLVFALTVLVLTLLQSAVLGQVTLSVESGVDNPYPANQTFNVGYGTKKMDVRSHHVVTMTGLSGQVTVYLTANNGVSSWGNCFTFAGNRIVAQDNFGVYINFLYGVSVPQNPLDISWGGWNAFAYSHVTYSGTNPPLTAQHTDTVYFQVQY
jgi:hypothetical protein